MFYHGEVRTTHSTGGFPGTGRESDSSPGGVSSRRNPGAPREAAQGPHRQVDGPGGEEGSPAHRPARVRVEVSIQESSAGDS